MLRRLSSRRKLPVVLAVTATAAAVGPLTWAGIAAGATPATASTATTVLQTNLVSDLPGVAAVNDPNLVNPWGISESTGSPFWISDNNAGLATLYDVPGASNTPVSIVPLAVNIPTPVSSTGGAPTGTVFNTASNGGAFKITGLNNKGQTISAPAAFLFDTEDGTIIGWNPAIDPTGKFAGPNGASAQAVIAVDNSGNNFTQPNPDLQTGAVYKGLAIATSPVPILPGDSSSTALLYASNFRAGQVEVYDAALAKVTVLPAGAFTDPALPAGYAPFDVQVLGGKVYVTYALQNAAKHDDVAGPHHGFVDVFNLDGTPGLPGRNVRLITGGPLDSPWGLAIAPVGFAGLNAPGGDLVLLVGNFGNGRVHAFDATTPTTGSGLGALTDPDGEVIEIDGLWALKVGNNGAGGSANAVYFTAGLFGETHGLFGSLTSVAPGSPEGPAEAQLVQADRDVLQLAESALQNDIAAGAPAATIRADKLAVNAARAQLNAAVGVLTDDIDNGG
jgi:uncharacterized protein (TIGR03118 family)